MKKNILAIHTGGTISMSSNNGVVSEQQKNPVTVENNLDLPVNVTEVYPITKPSPHITVKDMDSIKEIIQKHESEYDGFVITHGTDTLEETAYFLELSVNTKRPIVLTGAMRSFDELGSDGLYNYLLAIRVAENEASLDRGVLVVFNDEIHTARFVTKTHTSNVATFQSPNHGPIGFVTKDDVYYHHSIQTKEKFEHVDTDKKIALIKAHVDLDSLFFEAVVENNFDGLIVEALGQGNIPPSALDGLRKVIEADIPAVVVSRSFNGIVGGYYDYKGGGRELKNLGAIFSNGLNGQKARIKLLIALSNQLEYEELAESFRQN
ncbi:asparaginase [Corticicoccus populi]|uniref:Asparaginase n=1 Tax=Corticicoccus populi TaxID=1812821 RepID=A0ABW5WS78_9STAP